MTNAVYSPSDAIPIRENELETAPVGLYSVISESGDPVTSRRDHFDLQSDEIHKDVLCRMMARVDDSGSLPVGVYYAAHRFDGKRLVKVWEPL